MCGQVGRTLPSALCWYPLCLMEDGGFSPTDSPRGLSRPRPLAVVKGLVTFSPEMGRGCAWRPAPDEAVELGPLVVWHWLWTSLALSLRGNQMLELFCIVDFEFEQIISNHTLRSPI